MTPGPEPIPDEELLAELRAGAQVLGRPPSIEEMNEFGEYHSSTYYNRFGSWLEALEAAELSVSEYRRTMSEASV